MMNTTYVGKRMKFCADNAFMMADINFVLPAHNLILC